MTALHFDSKSLQLQSCTTTDTGDLQFRVILLPITKKSLAPQKASYCLIFLSRTEAKSLWGNWGKKI